MNKINYELATWICIYENNAKRIIELEKRYEAHPYKYIKKAIIAYLEDQKNLLKKINSCSFNKYYFDTFKVNLKYTKETKELKNINKVISSKKSSKAAYKVATSLLVVSLLTGFAPISTSNDTIDKTKYKPNVVEELVDSTEECIVESEYTQPKVKKRAEVNEVTTKTVEVTTSEAIEQQPEKNTTELENKYYDINCPEELQDYFYELENKWGIPASLAMLLIDQESNGQWTTNGVVSPTNDYGLPQINECNLRDINEKLGYTKNDILNDPHKSLDAMFYILNIIFDLYDYTIDNYDIENVCGTYNGYINWREKKQSLTYVEQCMERYNRIFTDNQDTEKLLVQKAY